MIQRVPTKPAEIDLPVCQSTELQKYSHKDFYDKKAVTAEAADETAENSEEAMSLIQKKLAAIKPQIEKHDAEMG